MNKIRFLTILIAAALTISCEKDYNDKLNPDDSDTTSSIDTTLTEFLKGWEISKTIFDFNINPQALFFTNSETGYFVGLNGTIYKTINSGESWQKQNSGTTLHLNSVFFLDQNTGFVSGQAMSGCLGEDCNKGGVFLKTINGGESWSKILFKEYNSIQSLYFFNESEGLATIYTPSIPNSRNYHIAKTNDGGNNWELIDLPIMSYAKNYCVDNVVFIAGENQKIYKSKDRGKSWETINTPIPAWDDVMSICFLDENIGFLRGYEYYKTINGGLSWDTINFPSTFFKIPHFFNENEGLYIEAVFEYVGGVEVFKGMRSYQTVDGGNNWSKSKLVDTLCLGRCYFMSSNLGYSFRDPEFFTLRKK